MKGRVFCVVLTAWLMALAANGQEKTEKVVVNVEPTPFNGLVCNQKNEPIKNAHIYVRDARRYAVSDRKGRFGLTNVSPDDTLHVVVKKLQYDIPVAGRKSIKLRLMDQKSYKAEEDQHLVDVGYGYVKRREHTGVSNGISGEELQRTGATNVLMALQGKIPGLNVSGSGFGEPNVSMRGINSINLSQTPLFIVDGIEVTTLTNVSVWDVDYVEVLKDASIYGSRGANGAILVHTKH